MTKERKLNQYTKEEVIQHYKEFATIQPEMFIDYTWKDLLDFQEGEDGNGAIADGTVPDLGKKAWEEVVVALLDDHQRAYNKLVGKKAIYFSDIQSEHTQLYDLKGEKKG